MTLSTSLRLFLSISNSLYFSVFIIQKNGCIQGFQVVIEKPNRMSSKNIKTKMCALACSTAHDWTVRRRNHFCLLWLIYFQTHKKAKVESVLIFLTRKTHAYKVNGWFFHPTVVRWEKVDILGFRNCSLFLTQEAYSHGEFQTRKLVQIWNFMIKYVL